MGCCFCPSIRSWPETMLLTEWLQVDTILRRVSTQQNLSTVLLILRSKPPTAVSSKIEIMRFTQYNTTIRNAGIFITSKVFCFSFSSTIDYICKKGKAVPLQAWSGPECSRKLRFPDFMTTVQDGGKVVSLRHRPPLPPGNAPGTHFC